MITGILVCLIQLGAAPTYADDIEPLVRTHCVGCHQPGEIGPMALTTYKSVAHWAPMILEVVEDGRMPPWGANPGVGSFANARLLSDAEKKALHDWADAGAPEGDPAKVPPFQPSKKEWPIETPPDLIVSMPEPFTVPASGADMYRDFAVDPHLDRDTWVWFSQFVPGNRKVIHHAGITIEPPSDTDLPVTTYADAFLTGFLPGGVIQNYQQADVMPDKLWGFRVGRLVPARSTLTFRMHYATVGTPQTDQSRVAMWFCGESEIDQVPTDVGISVKDLVIPPYEERVVVSRTIPPLAGPMTLYVMTVHMHLRGRSMQFTAHYPDGTAETLLDVQKYLFAWQDPYFLREPKVLPAGTSVDIVAVFDNSAKNPRNPDPSKEVRWGEMTTDEMMYGGLSTFTPRAAYMAARRKPIQAPQPAKE